MSKAVNESFAQVAQQRFRVELTTSAVPADWNERAVPSKMYL